MADFYQILGVSRDADADTLKKAYRKLARKYHPDVNKEPGAEDKFKEIGKAYEALADPETRARYDQFGEAGLGGAAGMPDMGDMGGFADLFETFFNGFGGQNPQGGRTQRRGPQQGDDLRYDLNMNLKMQYLANKEKLKYLILRHVKYVGEQVLNKEQALKLAQHVEVVDKLEEPLEHPLVISRK